MPIEEPEELTITIIVENSKHIRTTIYNHVIDPALEVSYRPKNYFYGAANHHEVDRVEFSFKPLPAEDGLWVTEIIKDKVDE